MGEPAELGEKDCNDLIALANAIIDGVGGDTANPGEVLKRFAKERDILVDTVILQMAQFMRLRDEELSDVRTILDDLNETGRY